MWREGHGESKSEMMKETEIDFKTKLEKHVKCQFFKN